MKLFKTLTLFAVLSAAFLLGSCIKDPQFKPAEIGVCTETVDLGVEASEETIHLFSNRDWKAEIIGSDDTPVTWLTLNVTEGTPMTDSLAIVINTLANEGEDRQATINFRTETIYASVRVSQKGAIQKQYTPISTVRALFKGSTVTVTEDYNIKGTVISDYRNSSVGGLNNYSSSKAVIIQDETAGIFLYLSENNTEYAPGDQITVKLKGLALQRYNDGSLQVNAVPLANLSKVGTATVEPKSISAADLLTGNYESQYVAVKDVQILSSDMGKTFVVNDKATSINFIDITGKKFVLFSSAYSSFGSQAVPTGSGILKGIGMVFGTTYQLSLASLSDFTGLTGTRFTEINGGGGGENPGTGLIGDYTKWSAITPASSFGDNFVTVTSGNTAYANDSWMFYTTDPESIYMGWRTGTYNADKYIQVAPYNSKLDEVVAYALMPKIKVSTAANKTLKFKLEIYFQTADASKLEVVTSKDFTGDFTKATWTVIKDATIEATEENKNVWKEFTVDFSSFASEDALCVAFRYTGKSNTYRLDDVQFNDGTFPEDPGTGGGGEGGGTAGDGIFTSNVDITSNVDANNASYVYTVTTGGSDYQGLKIGKSTDPGTYTTPVLSKTGKLTLTFYAVAWNNKTCNLKITVDNAGTIDGAASKSFTLVANSGTASTTTAGTLTFGKDFYTATLDGITSASTLTFSTDAAGTRSVIVGVNVKAAD